MQVVTIYATEDATIYELSGKVIGAMDSCQQNRLLLLETSVHQYIYPRERPDGEKSFGET